MEKCLRFSEDYYGDLDLKSIRKSELLAGIQGSGESRNVANKPGKPRPSAPAARPNQEQTANRIMHHPSCSYASFFFRVRAARLETCERDQGIQSRRRPRRCPPFPDPPGNIILPSSIFHHFPPFQYTVPLSSSTKPPFLSFDFIQLLLTSLHLRLHSEKSFGDGG